MMDVDAVAEAIYQADIQRDSIPALNWDEHYRRMARAAIDALQLTVEYPTWDGALGAIAYRGKARFVGPWVRVEESVS